MAINTEDRRRSAVGILPIADGTISGVDKQHTAGFYRGIPAAVPVITPYPLNISITESLEFGISITDTVALSVALYPELGLYPATTLYPFNGIYISVDDSAEYTITVSISGGS